MDSSNADPWEGFTGQSQADADAALIMDPLVRQISELRAALGDSEARRAELEAVIQRAREVAQPTANGEPLRERVIEALDSVPSVVLEDRDREVAARALDRAVEAIRENAGPENSDGICEGVSNWPRGHAAAYTTAVVEAVESIHALQTAIRKGDTNA